MKTLDDLKLYFGNTYISIFSMYLIFMVSIIIPGGTSTDVGVLMKAFPRHASSEVKIGGIRTNFRMPDVISIGLGGGSYVTHKGNKVKIGPTSAGYNIVKEAMVFADKGTEMGDRSITATDIAVAAGLAQVGNKENVNSIPKTTVEDGIQVLHQMVTDCLDQMRFNDRDLPLILVGGGSILIDEKHKFSGVSSIIKPEHFDVANAVGAALSQVSATVDDTLNLEKFVNKTELDEKIMQAISSLGQGSEETEESAREKVKNELMTKARDRAINECVKHAQSKVLKLGGKKESIDLLDKEDIPISYIPGHTRIKVKVVAELQASKESTCNVPLASLKDKHQKQAEVKEKQTVSATGKILDESDKFKVQSPTIDEKTGEWLISEYDIECISIGAGVLGSGGGGNPHLGKVAALLALRAGKQPRVITPSKFFKTADKKNDLTVLVAAMGAPTVLYEKLQSGTETKAALDALQDLYNIGKYKNGQLNVKEGVEIKEEEGLAYVDDYKPTGAYKSGAIDGKKIAAIMSAEIGGMNSIEPLLVGAELDLPVLDCDGMGRAFPELQMFAPFIYDCPCYPSAIADDKGRKSVALYASNPKRLEDCFRQAVISMGCTAGIVLTHFTQEQIMKYTVQHSTSYAWRIGNAVIEARRDNISPVDALIKLTNGKLLINGKLSDVRREVTGGFSRGTVKVVGIEDCTGQGITIDIQNEFLLARKDKASGPGEVVACVPDLITVLDIDTAQPISTDELQYGLRVSVVALPVAPLMATEKALKNVGPKAFGYPDDVQYKPVATYPDYKPVGLL